MDQDEFVVTEELREWATLKVMFDKQFPNQPGAKTFEHEGTKYSRSFRKQRSNSGKTFKWLMDFSVTLPDGTHRTIPDPSEPNRRNDASRNWGLGRE